MANKADVLKELGDVTDRLSSQVRTTAIAILAVAWGILIGDSPAAKALSSERKPILVLLGIMAVLVLFLDFLQYLAGYFSTRGLLRKIEESDATEGEYNYRGTAWRLRLWLFWVKQVLLIITVLVLFVVFGRWFIAG